VDRYSKPERKTFMRQPLALGRLAMACLALVTLAGLSACEGGSGFLGSWKQAAGQRFHAIDITGANYAQGFRLRDTQGQVRQLSDFKGKVVFVFFGFTQCPDVCPTTMAELAEVRERLGSVGQDVQGVFISIVPERDRPQVLQAYVQALDPSLVGLTGSPEEIKAAARDFKIFFQKVPTQDGQSYSMDHTAMSYVFDRAGQVRLAVRYGQSVDALTEDLRQLLSER